MKTLKAIRRFLWGHQPMMATHKKVARFVILVTLYGIGAHASMACVGNGILWTCIGFAKVFMINPLLSIRTIFGLIIGILIYGTTKSWWPRNNGTGVK